jgi:hypothetical protein
MRARHYPLYGLCLLFFAMNCALWQHARPMRPYWANTPPAPSAEGAAIGALGDRQFAFRASGLMLQNFGDTAGHVTPLKDYNFKMLGQWFMVEDALDPHSYFMPYIASFYYGASQDGSEIRPVIDYLAAVGRRDDPQSAAYNWRWMAQAVWLARFRLHDNELALKLANELAAEYKPGMPAWIKQMPVFVLRAKGDKDAAYALMVSILKDSARHMQPQEVNSIIINICTQLQTPQQAAVNPICMANAGLLESVKPH